VQRIMVSVYDKKAEEFQGLFLVPSLNVAIRMFIDTLSDSETVMCKHPADFALYQVGNFEIACGGVEPSLMLIIEAEEAIRRQPQVYGVLPEVEG
jgi:hypothetical protein